MVGLRVEPLCVLPTASKRDPAHKKNSHCVLGKHAVSIYVGQKYNCFSTIIHVLLWGSVKANDHLCTGARSERV